MSRPGPKKGNQRRDDRMYHDDDPRRYNPKGGRPRHHRLPLRFGPMGNPHMMKRNEIYRDLKELFILSALEESSSGLSEIQLQSMHGMSRGNIVRGLKILHEQGYIQVDESSSAGKKQNLYRMTDEGKSYLEELKERSAERNMLVDEIAPMGRYGFPMRGRGPRRRMHHQLESFTSKEDTLDYFRGMRHELSRHLQHLTKRLGNVQEDKQELDDLILQIEKLDSFNITDVKKIVNQCLHRTPPPLDHEVEE